MTGVLAAASPDLVLFFLVGLLGGAHCIGMCGPLVMLYSSEIEGDERALTFHEVRQHSLFNLGRTASYAVLGGITGFLGSVFFDISSFTAVGNLVRSATGILVGSVIVLAGLGYLIRGGGGGGVLDGAVFGGIMEKVLEGVRRRVGNYADGFGIVGLGAVHGFLPCPILYPAFLYSFARGSALDGFLSLAALGLGTFPAVFVYGTLVQSASVESRRKLHRVLGAVLILLGYIPISMGLNLLGVEVPRLMPPFYQPLS